MLLVCVVDVRSSVRPSMTTCPQAAPTKAQNPAFVSSLGQGFGGSGQMGTSNNNYARPAGQNVSLSHSE